MGLIRYIKKIFVGVWRLLEGMYITMLNFVRPKLTEQYPENRGKHVYFERFRAQLTMPHDGNNHHKCTGCGICMNNCPNGTIQVITKTETDPETGKSRRVIDKHLYNIGSCIFCDLCVQTCPFDAIEFSNRFEHSVFTKERLQQQLNRPGSSLKPKPAPATKTAEQATSVAAKPVEPAARPSVPDAAKVSTVPETAEATETPAVKPSAELSTAPETVKSGEAAVCETEHTPESGTNGNNTQTA